MRANEISPQLTFPELTRDEVFRLETPRLWLRWPQRADAADIALFAGLPQVAEMTASWPIGVTVSEVQSRIEQTRGLNAKGKTLRLVLVPKAARTQVIGQIGLDVERDGCLGLGYHLAPAYWGGGLMSEAVAELVTLGFLLTNAPSITADIRTINPASRRVLEKAGFVSSGNHVGQCGLRGNVEVEDFRLKRAGQPILAVA